MSPRKSPAVLDMLLSNTPCALLWRAQYPAWVMVTVQSCTRRRSRTERPSPRPRGRTRRASSPARPRAGTHRRPRLHAQADRRQEAVLALADQLDRRSGAGRLLDADRRRLAEGDRDAELVGQRRADDLLLDLAVQGHGVSSPSRRLISGSCSASCTSARWSAPRSASSQGTTTVSSVGGAKWCPFDAAASPSASPIRTSPSPHTRAISPARTASRRSEPNTLIAVTFSPASRSRSRTVPVRTRT